MTNARTLGGMAIGVLIMFSFGSLWLVIALQDLHHIPRWLLGLSAVVALTIMTGMGFVITKIARAARAGTAMTVAERSVGRKINRGLCLAIAAEAGAIFFAMTLLRAMNLQEYSLLAIALIVGLHFFPLARVFRVSVYYFTGIAGSLLALAALWIPAEPARHVFLGFSMGFVLWSTGLVVLYGAISFKGLPIQQRSEGA